MVRTTEDAIGSKNELAGAAQWDDGRHENVTNICVWHSELGVHAVQFGYGDGTEKVVGEVHGNIPAAATKFETALDPDEYIKVCIAHCGLDNAWRMEFHTNTREFACGVEIPSDLLHDDEDYFPATFGAFENDKIVGFHGTSGDMFLHKIGVHWGQISG